MSDDKYKPQGRGEAMIGNPTPEEHAELDRRLATIKARAADEEKQRALIRGLAEAGDRIALLLDLNAMDEEDMAAAKVNWRDAKAALGVKS